MNIKISECKAGLIGKGIQASLTPAMHMEEGRVQGLDYSYELIDVGAMEGGVPPLEAMLAAAEARGLHGVNITHPFKQQVIEHLTELSDDARALGAVNTVVLRGGKRIGQNTDWWGFSESFQRGLPDVNLASVVQLGAGGAGAATAYAILKLGAQQLTIFDPDKAKVDSLIEALASVFPNAILQPSEDIATSMASVAGLIHATPTGMASYPGLPLTEDLLKPHHWVAEVVYFPLQTELLRVAQAKGCAVLNGGGMAVFQAVGAFQHFTGLEANRQRMLDHFLDLTGQGNKAT
jgi:shikimate dehydrogenase